LSLYLSPLLTLSNSPRLSLCGAHGVSFLRDSSEGEALEDSDEESDDEVAGDFVPVPPKRKPSRLRDEDSGSESDEDEEDPEDLPDVDDEPDADDDEGSQAGAAEEGGSQAEEASGEEEEEEEEQEEEEEDEEEEEEEAPESPLTRFSSSQRRPKRKIRAPKEEDAVDDPTEPHFSPTRSGTKKRKVRVVSSRFHTGQSFSRTHFGPWWQAAAQEEDEDETVPTPPQKKIKAAVVVKVRFFLPFLSRCPSKLTVTLTLPSLLLAETQVAAKPKLKKKRKSKAANLPFVTTFEGDLPRQGPSTKVKAEPVIKAEAGVGSGAGGQFVGMDMTLGQKATYKRMIKECRVRLLCMGKPWAAAGDLLTVVGEVLDNARKSGLPLDWHAGLQQACYQNAKSFVSRCGKDVKERTFKHYKFEGSYTAGRLVFDIKERAAASLALETCENLRADGRVRPLSLYLSLSLSLFSLFPFCVPLRTLGYLADRYCSFLDHRRMMSGKSSSSSVAYSTPPPSASSAIKSMAVSPFLLLILKEKDDRAASSLGSDYWGWPTLGYDSLLSSPTSAALTLLNHQIIHALDVVKQGKGNLEFSERYQKDCLLVVRMGATLSWDRQDIILRKLWLSAASHTAGAGALDVPEGDGDAILKALCRKRG
ncbi:hypothetical protein P7C70_g8204, partial [Phenoliferia sp. Uapishka_3]